MNIANEVIVDSRTGVIAVYLAPKVNCFDELIDSEKLLLWIERPRDESMNWVHRDSDEEVAEKFAKVYRELLSLRTGEGDDEVDALEKEIQTAIDLMEGSGSQNPVKVLVQMLRFARKQHGRCADLIEQMRLATGIPESDPLKAVQRQKEASDIFEKNSADATELWEKNRQMEQQLRAAQADVERQTEITYEAKAVVSQMQKQIKELTAERDSLQSQLAAMQSASVGEVEEIVAEFQFRSDMPMNNHAFERMEKLARTLAAQRDSIISDVCVVLSKKWCLYEDFELMTRLNLLETYEPAKRLMEIVAASDGKSGSEVGT